MSQEELDALARERAQKAKAIIAEKRQNMTNEEQRRRAVTLRERARLDREAARMTAAKKEKPLGEVLNLSAAIGEFESAHPSEVSVDYTALSAPLVGVEDAYLTPPEMLDPPVFDGGTTDPAVRDSALRERLSDWSPLDQTRMSVEPEAQQEPEAPPPPAAPEESFMSRALHGVEHFLHLDHDSTEQAPPVEPPPTSKVSARLAAAGFQGLEEKEVDPS